MKHKRYNRGIIRVTASGKYYAEVNRDYRRRRRTFDKEVQAQDWIDAIVRELEKQNKPMDAAAMRDAQTAARILPQGVTLTEAAMFFADVHGGADIPITVAEAAARFIQEKQAAGLTSRSLQQIRYKLRRLAADIGPRFIQDVSGNLLIAWLDAHQYQGATRDGYRRTFRNFFGWCLGRQFTRHNPAEAIAVAATPDLHPTILPVEKVADVMRAAEQLADDLCPYLALGFFAGIRPSELVRLQWDDVTDRVRVKSQRKTQRDRHVTIPSNLSQWIESYRGNNGPVCPVTPKSRLKRMAVIKERACIERWPHDAQRHCFVAYHLALYQDPPRTAHEIGHASPGLLDKQYRNLALPEQAERYFQIAP